MAVVSRISTLRIDDPGTHNNFLQYQATAAVQDTAEGGSVDVTIVRTSGGVPPTEAQTLELKFYDGGTTPILTSSLTPGSASQTVTFHFKAGGVSGGAIRNGIVGFDLHAVRTSIPTYDVETDGSPNTPPTGFHSHTLDTGFINGTTTKTHAFSNVSAGGAKDEPAEYDESLFLQVTLGSVPFNGAALNVSLSAGSLSGSTGSMATGVGSISFANVVDERFAAAVTNITATVTAINSAVLGQPYYIFTSTTPDSIDVDPRNTVGSKLFQADDDVFGTPPMSKDDPSKAALVSSYSGVAYRIVTSRTQTGLNGLGYSVSLDPRNPGSVITGTGTTATKGGEAGWTDLVQLGPFVIGGGWDVSVDITSPSDIDNNAHLLSSTDVVTILAPDPRFGVFVSLVPLTASELDHLHAGDDMRLVATPFNRDSRKRITADSGTVTGTLVRYERDLARFEYLSSSNVWTHWSGTTTVADALALTDAGDGVTWFKNFLTTDGWGPSDIVGTLVAFEIGGTPYGFYVARELVGPYNSHAVAPASTLNDLTDVNTAGADSGEGLIFNGTEWTPASFTHSLDDHTDVNLTGADESESLVKSSTDWVPALGSVTNRNGSVS